RDWSSDVCSSDLCTPPFSLQGFPETSRLLDIKNPPRLHANRISLLRLSRALSRWPYMQPLSQPCVGNFRICERRLHPVISVSVACAIARAGEVFHVSALALVPAPVPAPDSPNPSRNLRKGFGKPFT